MTNNRKLWSASHSCRIAHFCYSYVVLESIRACFSPEYQNVSMYQAAKRCREKAPNQTLGLWLCYSWVSIQQVLRVWSVMTDVNSPGLPDLSFKKDPSISAICSSSQAEVPRKLMATIGYFSCNYILWWFQHENYAREVGSHERWENMCNKISIYNISICTACIQ